MQVGKLEEWSQEKNRGKIVVCKESFSTILATQTQRTAILRQLQHHLGLPSATEHLTPTTAVLHSEAIEPHAPLEPNTENTETSTWAISLPASFSPFLIIYILYFMYFFYNSIFWCLIFWDCMYYWWCIIYRHHFCLNLAYFYFLYSLTLLFFWNVWFLLHDSDSMSLRRYHFLPIFFNRFYHIEDNVPLGWGESWESKYC